MSFKKIPFNHKQNSYINPAAIQQVVLFSKKKNLN
jgi:hypothetical protein